MSMNSNTIKSIRNQLNLTQAELAQQLGVSFATVNRWENDRSKPSSIARHMLLKFCEDNQIKVERDKGYRRIVSNEKLTLFHGSREGLVGSIAPISREKCDFGKGFYMGTEEFQPLTLICNYPSAMLYTLKIDLSDLNILSIDIGLDWAMLIAYFRGKLDNVSNSAIYQYYASVTVGGDLIIGYIADDRMFVVLDRFFSGEITDIALIHCLSALKLGKQYVAITDKACHQIQIITEKPIDESQRKVLLKRSEMNRTKGIELANSICKQYRRDGRYFDEIIKEFVE